MLNKHLCFASLTLNSLCDETHVSEEATFVLRISSPLALYERRQRVSSAVRTPLGSCDSRCFDILRFAFLTGCHRRRESLDLRLDNSLFALRSSGKENRVGTPVASRRISHISVFAGVGALFLRAFEVLPSLITLRLYVSSLYVSDGWMI